MMTDSNSERLTDGQRKTVEENLGLVGMIIKRVLGRSVPHASAHEYYEELLQEGCLGLMQAVRTYGPRCGTAFTSYALPRVHYAVWRALRCYRETIRLPERQARPRGGWCHVVDTRRRRSRFRRANRVDGVDNALSPRGEDSGEVPLPISPASAAASSRRARSAGNDAPVVKAEKGSELRVRSFPPEDMDRLPAKSDPSQSRPELLDAEKHGGGATLGEMIRRKLEAAVESAVEQLFGSCKAHGGRPSLARWLADRRLLVPDAEFQSSLRDVARDTGSSYGRVTACEAVLLAETRRLLAGDVEFECLCQARLHCREGVDARMDRELHAALLESVSRRLSATFGRLSRTERADFLLTVLERTGVDIEALFQAHARSLAEDDRTQLATRFCLAGAA